MAMVGCCFRTEEACTIESFGSYSLFDLTFGHKGKKTIFVNTPIALFFFKRFKHCVSWGQKWLMQVFDISNFLKEIG